MRVTRMGRADGPGKLIGNGYLGRWPRLVWGRAVGPWRQSVFSNDTIGFFPAGEMGNAGQPQMRHSAVIHLNAIVG
jgi:hypothetical protein